MAYAMIGVLLAVKRLSDQPSERPAAVAERPPPCPRGWMRRRASPDHELPVGHAPSCDHEGPHIVHLVTSDAFAGIERHVLRLARELAGARVPRGNRLSADSGRPPRSRRGRSAACASRRRLRVGAAGSRASDSPGSAQATGPARPRRARRCSRRRARSARADSHRPDAALHPNRVGRASRVGPGCVYSRCIAGSTGGSADTSRVSRSVADAARERAEVGGAELVVIPPAMDLPEEAAVVRAREARAASRHPVIAYVGRLEPDRRIDVLVRAIPEVRRRIPGTRFVIRGIRRGRGVAEAARERPRHRP